MKINVLFNIFSKDKIKDNHSEINATRKDLVNKLESGAYNLVLDQARYPLNSLSAIFKDYDLNPEYQRNQVWDISRKSKLIESLIINIPIPPIFLYETALNRFEVMDGLQRISTIIGFLNNQFMLTDLEIWAELNGKYFKDLFPEFQDSIRRRYLSATIILKETRNTSEQQNKLKQLVFERLNTGGIRLTPQEIRNAANIGTMNSMINDLGDNFNEFKEMIKYPKDYQSLQNDEIDRMADREMVLRFLAYKDAIINNEKKGTKYLLDTYAKLSISKTEGETEDIKNYFKAVTLQVYDLFGGSGYSRSHKSEKMIYDTIMLSVSKLIDNGDSISSKFTDVSTNNRLKDEFFEKNETIFNGKYTSLNKVNERVESFYSFLLSGDSDVYL
ncbi:DUF262 domain-containing protein [Lactococcus lactis]|jgi:uncharacterized protein with ParB-like and HNH nuclease domain|uniref:DUF262 domain-containing protein n=1 Tax=Lactococcus lactis TaxID=1358 RepID=UPI0022E49C4F|nr:DUF262 domain-containing protein [Lactococcus lactis]MDR1822637.1 DUF262 domain-containing protein [Lactococcus lactis]MDR2059354.1 DUF262 domain-containing protein [Lactococcus lactis]